jgi:hypothetical protein
MTRIAQLDWVLHLKGWTCHPILAWRIKNELWTYPEEGAVYTISGRKTQIDPRGKPYYIAPGPDQLDQI